MIQPLTPTAMMTNTDTPALFPEFEAAQDREHARAEARRARARKTARRMVEVAPGYWRPVLESGNITPSVVIAEYVEMADGTFKLIPRSHEHMVRLTHGVAKALGMGDRMDTLYRLITAGFIEGIRVAPRVTLLNLKSWFNHVDRCAANSEFWSGKRLEHYLKSIG